MIKNFTYLFLISIFIESYTAAIQASVNITLPPADYLSPQEREKIVSGELVLVPYDAAHVAKFNSPTDSVYHAWFDQRPSLCEGTDNLVLRTDVDLAWDQKANRQVAQLPHQDRYETEFRLQVKPAGGGPTKEYWYKRVKKSAFNASADQLEEYQQILQDIKVHSKRAMHEKQERFETQQIVERAAASENAKMPVIKAQKDADLEKLDKDKTNKLAIIQAQNVADVVLKDKEELTKKEMNEFKWNRIVSSQTFAYTAAAASIVIISYFGAKHGVPLFFELIKSTPETVLETSILSLGQKIKKTFGYKVSENNMDASDIVMPASLEKQLTELTSVVSNAAISGSGFPVALFHGPPGTGKTLAGKIIAKNKVNEEQAKKMEYVIMSGSALTQLPAGKDIETFNKILKYAKNNKAMGAVLFIDEADSMLPDRRMITDQKKIDFVNFFLSNFPETTHEKIFLVLSTNHPDLIDKAVLDRVGYFLEFTLPNAEERTKILSMHLHKKFGDSIAIKPQVKEHLHEVAADLENFSGRELQNVASRMKSQLDHTEQSALTLELLKEMCEILKKEKATKLQIDRIKKRKLEEMNGVH